LWEQIKIKLKLAASAFGSKTGTVNGNMLLEMRTNDIGTCEHCEAHFEYHLIHNGFGDSSYAYCDKCGKACLLSGWFKGVPKDANLKIHKCITPEVESFLQACSCGGRFKSGASPRCPTCHKELSADRATVYIEKNAPGTAKGWNWQRNWTDLYMIIINNLVVRDNWRD